MLLFRSFPLTPAHEQFFLFQPTAAVRFGGTHDRGLEIDPSLAAEEDRRSICLGPLQFRTNSDPTLDWIPTGYVVLFHKAGSNKHIASRQVTANTPLPEDEISGKLHTWALRRRAAATAAAAAAAVAASCRLSRESRRGLRRWWC